MEKSFDSIFNALQVMSRVMKKEMEAVMSRVMEKEVEEMERRKKWECVSRNSIFMAFCTVWANGGKQTLCTWLWYI